MNNNIIEDQKDEVKQNLMDKMPKYFRKIKISIMNVDTPNIDEYCRRRHLD